LEKPSMRVYSSPKPTQPDSSTMGEAKSRPQNRRRSSCGSVAAGCCTLSGLPVAMAGIIAYRCKSPLTTMFNIVLFQPEIPPNTGNIIRLCANSGSTLHLVKPLAFELTRKAVRRAGLDYEELAAVCVHESLSACLAALTPGARVFSIETQGIRLYSEADFKPGDALLFGPETRGLPAQVLAAIPHECQLRIPMQPGNRSLNLSNAVALTVYEAWRQQGFASSAVAART
jgi:tRNA (cytidine/uridine-2'-O-)-methyltransferase